MVGWHVAWASGAFQEGLFPVGITPELLEFPVMQKIQAAKELHSDLVILQLSGGDGEEYGWSLWHNIEGQEPHLLSRRADQCLVSPRRGTK